MLSRNIFDIFFYMALIDLRVEIDMVKVQCEFFFFMLLVGGNIWAIL